MNKEFIPYEQALELKELGFDEECMFSYKQTLLQVEVPAPLYQQAFRWFRDKYDLDISIKGTHFRAVYVVGIPKNINYNSSDGHPLVIDWDYILDESGKIKTYEESELDCLRKLIEIVKNK